MQFRVGQTVKLVNNKGMDARVGSIAVIESIDKEFLFITWTTPQMQSGGAYYPYHFKPNCVRGEQLEFSFMET